MDLKELVDKFIQDQPERTATGLSSSRESRMYALRLFDAYVSPIGGFTESCLRSYRQWLIEQGYKPYTIQSYLSAARKFGDWLVFHNYLSMELWGRVKEDYTIMARPAPASYPRIRISEKYLHQVLEHLSERPEKKTVGDLAMMNHLQVVQWLICWRDRALFNLLADTALRISETLSLKVQPFEQFIASVGTTEVMVLDVIGKGNTQDVVVVSPQTIEMIYDWLEAREKTGWEFSDWLFIPLGNNKEEKPLSRKMAWLILQTAARELGLDPTKKAVYGQISPHAFRHLVARKLREQGVPIELIAGITRHKNTNTTRMIYAGPVGENQLIETAQKAWKKE